MIEHLFWTRDEDGEVIHRLGHEWDGNHGPWKEWGKYLSEVNNWSISIGATWSRWGLGIEFDWNHWGHWVNQAMRRVNARHQTIVITFGPWYLAWARSKQYSEPTL